VELAIKRRREELIEKMIKGQLRTDDYSKLSNDMSLLTNQDLRIIGKHKQRRFEAEREKRLKRNRQEFFHLK
jgi:hypothetical protein